MVDPNNPYYQQYPPTSSSPVGPDAPTEAYFPQLPPQAGPLPPRVRPEHLIRRNQSVPGGSLPQKMAYLWRSDPAYRVLYISLAFVIVAFLIFFLVVGGIFAHGNSPSQTQQQAVSKTNTGNQPPKQHNNQPGGKQKAAATQPTPQSTPTLAPTPTPIPTQAPTPTPKPQPTPTTIPTQLAAQITNAPNIVQNNNTVGITVQANQPNASVVLFVFYEGIPTETTTGPVQTDGNGTATLNWNIHEHRINRNINMIIARMTAQVTGQNGQHVQTQTVTVQIQTGN